jgi:hypothetical protein
MQAWEGGGGGRVGSEYLSVVVTRNFKSSQVLSKYLSSMIASGTRSTKYDGE